jgi:uncharacterized protein YbjT (DUF2867 family)
MTPPVAAARVLVAGATGLVGRALVELLQGDPRVAALTLLQRRAAAADTTPRTRRLAVDFDALDAAPAEWFAAEAAFCALGTTIRVAGSQAAFRLVDHDFVLAFARRAREGGASRFGLVSALGADPRSRVFYNRVKGETEAALRALGFERLAIARPSLLLGARDEFRLGERLMAPIGRLLPSRWRAIGAAQVARALIEATLAPGSGVRVLENAELLRG